MRAGSQNNGGGRKNGHYMGEGHAEICIKPFAINSSVKLKKIVVQNYKAKVAKIFHIKQILENQSTKLHR